MATTSFSLGDHFAGFIDAQVAAGRYGSASDVMRAALRLLEDHEERRQTLRHALQEGLDSGAGEPFDMGVFLTRMQGKHGAAD